MRPLGAEILEEIGAAKTYYKGSFSGNLSSYLDNLVKAKRLNLVAKETYALPNAERQNFERVSLQMRVSRVLRPTPAHG